MDGFFIDKLCVTQDHTPINGELLPFMAQHRYIKVDLQTGQETEHYDNLKFEGSYSSSLLIKCNGYKVEVRGNPSRWQRIDNLFGYETFDECMAVYNRILEGLGLPVFTKCTTFVFRQSAKGQGTHDKIYNGAVITHIDFTRNLSVGQGREKTYLKGLSTQSISRSIPPFLYPDECTVEWYGAHMQKMSGSTYRYIKVYVKTSDLLRNQKKNLAGGSFDDHKYFDDLVKFTSENGVIREEHSFKREYLKRHDLCAWGLVEEQAFKNELETIAKLRERLEVSDMELETIGDRLIEAGICKTRYSANATEFYYSKWLYGQYFDKTTSHYFKHKKRLLQLGIDISIKLDISRAPLRFKNVDVIEVRAVQPPSWYRHPVVPKVSHLRLVA